MQDFTTVQYHLLFFGKYLEKRILIVSRIEFSARMVKDGRKTLQESHHLALQAHEAHLS